MRAGADRRRERTPVCPDELELAVYLDGVLAPAERKSLELHLTDCGWWRLAGRDQTAPERRNQGQCFFVDRLVAYPAIDPNNAPATELIPTTTNPYRSCHFCMEGAEGGW